MSITTIRHYDLTLAYNTTERQRKIREMKKRFKIQLSRRRFKQSIRAALSKFEHSTYA